jgi:hypothetical protein
MLHNPHLQNEQDLAAHILGLWIKTYFFSILGLYFECSQGGEFTFIYRHEENNFIYLFSSKPFVIVTTYKNVIDEKATKNFN